jgi:hypothetical protein
MLHLLEPIWLAAMAAISVPVAVHLWNDRRGKVLRIGSVALLSGASKRLAWSRRITQWWLLLLRCLLLVVLAFLLVGLYWTRLAQEGKGWVLAEGDGGPFVPVIDSLVKAGYERHALGGGGNNWAGFREADSMALPGRSFYIFSTGLAGRFCGERPSTERDVHWDVYAPRDSVTRWVQRAWLSSADSVMVLVGSSRATGTVWQRRMVPVRPGRYGELQVGPGVVAIDSQAAVRVDTAAIRVRIVADGNYITDGKYVEAAVKALRRVTGRHIVFGDGGWLFWLSGRPVAGEGYERLWCYAQGKEVAVDTWMEGVRLTKEIAVVPAGASVWTDGYGRGILQREGKVFRFYSRLDPNWGDLVWSGRLPVLLEGLMIGDEEIGSHDRRVLDVAQIRPAVGRPEIGRPPKAEGRHRSDGVANARKEAGLERVDLRPALWVLALLIFLMERIKANQYGKA